MLLTSSAPPRASAPFSDCPHRPACPGCPRFGEGGVDAELYAQLAGFAASQGLPAPELIEGPLRGYRHRARLAVRGSARAPRIGIFEAGTHRVVPVSSCAVHHPLINQVSAAVREAMLRLRVVPYVESTQSGSLRYLQIAVERESQSAQLVLVTCDETPEAIAPLAETLLHALGPRLHSLFWNGNRSPHNAILGPDWHRFGGPPALRERFGGAPVFYPPAAFGQSNLPLAERLIGRLRGWVPEGARVAEFYAGAGAIGLSLLERAQRVDLNELAAGSLEGLAQSTAALRGPDRARVGVHPGPAVGALALLAGADVAIADPPRRGLDAELRSALRDAPPPRFIHVSCDPAAFLRDAGALLEGGRLALCELVLFAMFPFTRHLEVLARFERRPDTAQA